MLLNLVRLRYFEIPVFLTLSSIVTQYFYQGGVAVHGSAGSASVSADVGDPLWFIGGDATAQYSERPTITYSPIKGEEFARQMLSPISSEMIFSLVQSGWPPEQLLIMSLERLNHIENVSSAPYSSSETINHFRNFRHVVDLIIELAKRDALEMQSDKAENGSTRYLVFEEGQDRETQRLTDELKDLLDLDPQKSVFRVTDRLTRRKSDEITIRVRSLLTLMGFLSQGVEVPPEHIEEKRALKLDCSSDKEDRSVIPLWIRSSSERPSNAYVAVRDQDYWFFIPNSDHISKQAFGLLTYLFTLKAPAAPSTAPVLTIPTSQ